MPRSKEESENTITIETLIKVADLEFDGEPEDDMRKMIEIFNKSDYLVEATNSQKRSYLRNTSDETIYILHIYKKVTCEVDK